MDRGGTITWYLNANDVAFMATLAKARAEAKATGADIDRSLSRSTVNARTGFQNLGNDTNTLSGSLRNLRKDTIGLDGDSNGLRNSLTGVSASSNSLAATLGATALSSNGLRGSFGNLTNDSNRLNSALGSNALRGFGVELGNTERAVRRSDVSLRSLGLSLRDFHHEIGSGATIFRNYQIALRGFELTALIIAATAASGAILELAGNVLALGGVLVAAPAAVGVFASALATLKIATGGMGKALKEAIKPIKGATAAQSLAKRQSDITAQAMKRDADLVRRLNDLHEQYGDTLKELANERMRELNEQIQKGIDAWTEIAKAANSYLDISKGLADLNLGVAQAQAALTSAVFNYGAASQQAVEASRDLFVAQGKLAQANADLDQQYSDVKDSVKNLATNLNSLRKANRNQITATQDNLKALRLDKQARGESTDEITDMIAVLDKLANIKDTDLSGPNPDLADAQKQLDELKATYPSIAVAAKESASDTEKSLVKALDNISKSMADVRRERNELATDMQKSLADAANQSAIGQQGKDPFEGLSRNARAFAEALVDLYNKFQPIKHTIQDKLFAGLDTEIRNVAAVSFPTLEKGLGRIATAMNGVAKEASRVVQEPFFQGAMAASMETTAKSTDILKGAIEPLARIITNLTNIGNPYIILLSKWAVRQAKVAASFTGSESGQKKLTKALDLGITALKQIMKLFGAVGKLIYDVFVTANDSGFSMVKTLTQIVDNVDKWVKTKEGQESLKALFEASSTILLALAQHVGDVLQILLAVVKVYNDMDGPFKTIITNTIVWTAALSPLLKYMTALTASLRLVFGVGREAFQAGIAGVKLFRNAVAAAPEAMAGFKAGLDGIKVANEGAAGAFGKVGNAIGGIRNGFSTGISKVKDFGVTLATVVKDSAIKAGTLAANGAKAAAGWVAGAAKASAAWLKEFAVMIARAVVVVATMVADAAVAAAAWIAGAVAVAAAWVVANLAMIGVWGLVIAAVVAAVFIIVNNWNTIKAAILAVWDWITQNWPLLLAILTGPIGLAVLAITKNWDTIKGVISGVIDWVKTNWPLLLAIITGPIGLAVLAITRNWDTIKGVFSGAWDFIKRIWGGVAGWFANVGNGIVSVFSNVKNGVINAFNAAINWIRGVPGAILGALGNLGQLLHNSGWSLIMGLWNGISDAFGRVIDWTAGRLRSLRNLFPFSPAKEGPFSGTGYTSYSGLALMEDFGKGITDGASGVISTAQSIVGRVADTFSGMATNVGAVQSDFALNASGVLEQQLAPSMSDNKDGTGIGGGASVVINQTNDVHTDLDMDQVNRNLAWEMNKL